MDVLSAAGMLSLIFGGCCSNVFALEAIIKAAPDSGTLITATQFALVSLVTLPKHLTLSSNGLPHLKERAIPFRTWLQYTAYFVAINLLNNKAFGYKISVPLHIILRSAGPVATMSVGYFYGRRYTVRQVLAVALLFIGVVQAAAADALQKGKSLTLSAEGASATSSMVGFGLLFLALMLSAVMGVFTDRTYAKYGREHWMENLFYSHTLSLPVFLLYWNDVKAQAQSLASSPSFLTTIPDKNVPSPVLVLIGRIPIQLVWLLVNAVTQYVCIRGVNLLSARSSSLTVTIVLNVRKVVSLLLSIWIFGNRLSLGVLSGAALVFLGGGLYSLPSRRGRHQEGRIGSIATKLNGDAQHINSPKKVQ